MQDPSFSRLSLAALAFGLVLSLAAGYAADRLWRERLLREFQARAADVLDLAEQRLSQYETRLKTAYSHYEANRILARGGFGQYLRRLRAQTGLARLELVSNDGAAPRFDEEWARLELADGGTRKTLVWHVPMRPLGSADGANPKEAVEAGFELGQLFRELFKDVRLGDLKAKVYLEGEGIPERYARFEPAYATAEGPAEAGDFWTEMPIPFAAATLRLFVYSPPPAWAARGPGAAAAALGFLLNLLLLRALRGRHLRLLQAHERAVALYERGEAAAFIVHELPQPLTGVIGCLEGSLLRLDRGEAPADVLRRDLEQARDSALRMGDFLEDLRRHAKHDADAPAPVAVAPLLRGVAALAGLDPRMGGLAPAIAADGAGLQVFASPIALEMLLLNLLRNAAEAIRDAGVGGSVSLEAWGEEGKVLLRVCDDGPGLAAPDSLFEPFRTTKPYGSGLGLVYCQRQARRFGGGIEGGNRPEGGACFTVTLPRWTGRTP